MKTEAQYPEDELLPLSAISDVVFCQRRAALHLLERIWQDNLYTAEGTISHDRVHGLAGTEVRGKVRIARGLLIRSLRLGLSGKADVVEFHRVECSTHDSRDQMLAQQGVRLPSAKGFWSVFPVEYKVGLLRSNRSFEVQLCAQAMCLEEMLQLPISRGAIYFGKTGRRLELQFDESLRSDTTAAAELMHDIAGSGHTPQVEYGKKCRKCSLLDACMPKVTGGGRKVGTYLKTASKEAERGLE